MRISHRKKDEVEDHDNSIGCGNGSRSAGRMQLIGQRVPKSQGKGIQNDDLMVLDEGWWWRGREGGRTESKVCFSDGTAERKKLCVPDFGAVHSPTFQETFMVHVERQGEKEKEEWE